jgi:hypothetical protein
LAAALTVPSFATWYAVRSSAHLSILPMPFLRALCAGIRSFCLAMMHCM